MLAGLIGDRDDDFIGRTERWGVAGRKLSRSVLLRRVTAGEVGADAGIEGTERECLCMVAMEGIAFNVRVSNNGKAGRNVGTNESTSQIVGGSKQGNDLRG